MPRKCRDYVASLLQHLQHLLVVPQQARAYARPRMQRLCPAYAPQNLPRFYVTASTHQPCPRIVITAAAPYWTRSKLRSRHPASSDDHTCTHLHAPHNPYRPTRGRAGHSLSNLCKFHPSCARARWLQTMARSPRSAAAPSSARSQASCAGDVPPPNFTNLRLAPTSPSGLFFSCKAWVSGVSSAWLQNKLRNLQDGKKKKQLASARTDSIPCDAQAAPRSQRLECKGVEWSPHRRMYNAI